MSEVRKRGRKKGTTKLDHPNYSKAHRPTGTKKRDPEYRDFEDMQLADYVQRRIAELTGQCTTPLDAALAEFNKEFKRGYRATTLMKEYRRGQRLLDECGALGISFEFSGDTPDTLKKQSRSLASTLADIRPARRA